MGGDIVDNKGKTMKETINSQSFIIKIWLEDNMDQSKPPSWRGNITHVLSNERLYFQSLEEVKAFLAEYLHKMGVKI